jgi:hypothetical protein
MPDWCQMLVICEIVPINPDIFPYKASLSGKSNNDCYLNHQEKSDDVNQTKTW